MSYSLVHLHTKGGKVGNLPSFPTWLAHQNPNFTRNFALVAIKAFSEKAFQKTENLLIVKKTKFMLKSLPTLKMLIFVMKSG